MLRTSALQIKEIYLDSNEIRDDYVKSLGEIIKSDKPIEVISLMGTRISDTGIEMLLPYLDGNKTLKKLYLSSNLNITNRSMPLLAKMVETSRIDYLAIEFTSIDKIFGIAVPLGYNSLRNESTNIDLSMK